MCAGCRWDFQVKNWEDITYIEIWSQEDPMVRTKNIMAIEWWTKLLNEGHHIACTAGRDWHFYDSEPVILTATYLAAGWQGHGGKCAGCAPCRPNLCHPRPHDGD